MSRGESITIIMTSRGILYHFRGFPFYKLKHQFVLRGNQAPLNLIKYPGGVMVLLIMSWGNNDLIKGCPGGMIAI